ncbi:hypothetical protein GNF72_04635 [Clostridium perfringens]|uniref:hypothetical protein n=1 Tax=Clostridium perfringens TaxID=1502 RepID=UPI0023F7E70E|nr:hypothetical protein [Clostridium perfringens]MDU7547990.1 hypothetical protein [Clostridium perfringens]MDZ5014551.1 hypothetical protein [Clostridium perfringens]WEV20763.1 hypothetical protein PL327_08565 [Clostridium perfringens D]
MNKKISFFVLAILYNNSYVVEILYKYLIERPLLIKLIIGIFLTFSINILINKDFKLKKH